MFGAEPQEKWTAEEAAGFDTHVASQTRRMLVAAGWATGVFSLTVLVIIPFSAGHSLHAHWETVGKHLVILAMAEFVWLVLRWGYVYSSWQSAREVRREMADRS